MRLTDWLVSNRLSGSQFAKRVGVPAATINRLIPKPGKKQTRKPGRRLLPRIVAATGGEVTANDFMDDPEADAVQGNVSPAGDPSQVQLKNRRRVTRASREDEAA